MNTEYDIEKTTSVADTVADQSNKGTSRPAKFLPIPTFRRPVERKAEDPIKAGFRGQYFVNCGLLTQGENGLLDRQVVLFAKYGRRIKSWLPRKELCFNQLQVLMEQGETADAGGKMVYDPMFKGAGQKLLHPESRVRFIYAPAAVGFLMPGRWRKVTEDTGSEMAQFGMWSENRSERDQTSFGRIFPRFYARLQGWDNDKGLTNLAVEMMIPGEGRAWFMPLDFAGPITGDAEDYDPAGMLEFERQIWANFQLVDIYVGCSAFGLVEWKGQSPNALPDCPYTKLIENFVDFATISQWVADGRIRNDEVMVPRPDVMVSRNCNRQHLESVAAKFAEYHDGLLQREQLNRFNGLLGRNGGISGRKYESFQDGQ